jgi:hypothetical protein
MSTDPMALYGRPPVVVMDPELFKADYKDLVKSVREAFENQDIVTLWQIDLVIRDRLFMVLNGTEKATAFEGFTLEVLCAVQAGRSMDEYDVIVCRWTLVHELAEGLARMERALNRRRSDAGYTAPASR